VIGASIVLGVFAFVALSGIVVVLAAVLGIRLWWLNRKRLKQNGPDAGRGPSRPGDNVVIEGEYRVVSVDKKKDESA
jgi:hypothetical protein